MKLMRDGIEWSTGYVYWWNWLSKGSRYLGVYAMYYDGPHWSFGFWFFNVSWQLPFNRWDSSRYMRPWLNDW